ncbi:MAG: hypothetical protein JXR51_10375 [Bacteroidales bacterium]|nr:hypothetical protein [Bacteroidales bacterium]MBN2757571.1 hypothetical protein [Bacteroidales bacterium]
MILGLLTIIPANIALDEKKFKWNYFVGAWTLIKYNPITILAILGFISGYFSYIIDIVSINTSDKLIGILFIICFILIAVTAFVLGILIIIKTERQIKLRKSQSIFD